jgi:hypothetical protein
VQYSVSRDVADNIRRLRAGVHRWLHGVRPACFEAILQETLPREIGLIDAWCPILAIACFRQSCSCSSAAMAVRSCSITTALLCRPRFWSRPQTCWRDQAKAGPAHDGGYYLLGVKRARRRLFEDIAWSTEHVARQTLDRAAGAGGAHSAEMVRRHDLRALKMLPAELFEDQSYALICVPASRSIRAS